VQVTDDGTISPPAPGGATTDRAAHAYTLVADWLFSEPMAHLLDAFGARLPAAGASGDRIAGQTTGGLSPEQTDILRRALAVERIAAADFNFRGDVGQQYRERAEATVADFDPEFRRRILALTDRLGLVSPRPPRFRRYDQTLILGGGYRSPLLRTRYAAQLRAGGVDLGELSFLGSPRFLIEEPSEHAVTESYAPGAVDEFDLMIGGARTEFGWTAAGTAYLCGCPTAQAHCPQWSHRDADQADQTPPAYTHERRAPLVDSAGRSAGSVLSASTGRPPYGRTRRTRSRCGPGAPGRSRVSGSSWSPRRSSSRSRPSTACGACTCRTVPTSTRSVMARSGATARRPPSTSCRRHCPRSDPRAASWSVPRMSCGRRTASQDRRSRGALAKLGSRDHLVCRTDHDAGRRPG
jgi:hypothetical protein